VNSLVMILSDDDGEKIPTDERVWHLISPVTSDPSTLCHGEYFGAGQSAAKYKLKDTKKGGITCRGCLSIISAIKAVNL